MIDGSKLKAPGAGFWAKRGIFIVRSGGVTTFKLLEKRRFFFWVRYGSDGFGSCKLSFIARLLSGADAHEADDFGGVLEDGLASEVIAVFKQGYEILDQGYFLASFLKTMLVKGVGLGNSLSGGLGLSLSALVDGLGFEVILVSPEPPVAEIILINMLSVGAEVFDDLFIGQAVVDHVVDLGTYSGGQASDFAVATGPGLAGLQLASEVEFEGVGEQGGHKSKAEG